MNNEQLFHVYFNEYSSLKSEQHSRIGFRDNLLYVMLGLFGGITSYSLSDAAHYPALLVIPWVCFILGWTYLVNDEKISAIGRYIRLELAEKLETLIQAKPETLLRWEVAHRDDQRRKSRKIIQLLVDEITFCLIGIIALFLYATLASSTLSDWRIIAFLIFEFSLQLFLGYWIWVYADLQKGR